MTSIIGLAHGLGMTVVCEGIETAEQHQRLIELGSDFCEGFYFAEPMPAPTLDALIQQQAAESTPGLPGIGMTRRIPAGRSSDPAEASHPIWWKTADCSIPTASITNGARRFEDFQRGIGLARNVLTDRLNWLVDHGILERRPYAEHTARELNEYRLTDKGRALFPVYTALLHWGNEWTDLPAPPVDLLHKPCGHRVSVRVVCSQCGQDIDIHDTEPVVGRGLVMHRHRR